MPLDTTEAQLVQAVASLLEVLSALNSGSASRSIAMLRPFAVRGVDNNYADQLSANLSKGMDAFAWSPEESALLAPHLARVGHFIAQLPVQP